MAVYPHAHIALLARAFKLLCVFALSALYNGGEYLYFAARRQFHYSVYDLVGGLAAYFLTANRAVRNTYARI